MPYILTTFANDQRNFLEALGEEDDQVQNTLLPGVVDGRFTVFRDSFISRDKLAHYLRLLRYDLFCFHFSGHAGEDLLQLGDGNARAEGLLGLLGSCLPGLKLVVLNGCGTLQQAEVLHAAGIPNVIATTAPVGDAAATDFSVAFYQELMLGETIQVAFDRGLDAVKLRREVVVLRTPSQKGSKTSTGTWCFFTNEKSEDLTLPVANQPTEAFDFKPNSILTRALFNNLNLQSRQLKRLREDVADRLTVSRAKRRMAVVNCLPAPVGEALRKLLCPVDGEGGYDQLNVIRLRQIVVTYVTMMELLIYTLIAQLFEHGLQGGKEENQLPPLLDQEIRDFLALDDAARASYQYIYLIRNLRMYLEATKVDFFVAELATLADVFNREDSRFTAACAEIEALRLRLNLESGGIPTAMVGPLCKDTESHLAEILGHLGFMSNYTMATVRNIDVIKYKHQPDAHFMHELVRLIDVQGKVDVDALRINDFMDNRSVLLIKDLDRLNVDTLPPFLNLSPFIMDRSAFVPHGDASQLHFFFQVDAEGKRLLYKSLKKPEDDPWEVLKRMETEPNEEEADPMADLVTYRQAFVYEQFEAFLNLLDQHKAPAA